MRFKVSSLFEMVVVTLSILNYKFDPSCNWYARKPVALCECEEVYAIEEQNEVSVHLFCKVRSFFHAEKDRESYPIPGVMGCEQ